MVQTAPKKRLPMREGRFVIPETPREKPYLLASRCTSCGKYFSSPRVICLNCRKQTMQTVSLAGKGKIYSYTTVWQQLPGSVVKVPYAIVIVSMPEGCQVHGVVTEELGKLEVGKEVEVYFEKAAEDKDGNDLFIDKFRVI